MLLVGRVCYVVGFVGTSGAVVSALHRTPGSTIVTDRRLVVETNLVEGLKGKLCSCVPLNLGTFHGMRGVVHRRLSGTNVGRVGPAIVRPTRV